MDQRRDRIVYEWIDMGVILMEMINDTFVVTDDKFVGGESDERM